MPDCPTEWVVQGVFAQLRVKSSLFNFLGSHCAGSSDHILWANWEGFNTDFVFCTSLPKSCFNYLLSESKASWERNTGLAAK